MSYDSLHAGLPQETMKHLNGLRSSMIQIGVDHLKDKSLLTLPDSIIRNQILQRA